jgi:hypothetical protein
MQRSSLAPVAQDNAKATSLPDNGASAAVPCPRCGARMIDPNGLGWCQGCGYCHTLAQEKADPAAPAPPPPPSPLGTVEIFEVVRTLPGWVWVLLAGMVAIVGASFVPGTRLPRTGLVRATWATVQLAAGLLMIFAAQVWALLVLAPDDERLGNRDAILPARLWAQIFRKLPRTFRQVQMGAWGLAAVLSAVLIVGGFSHWLTYLPRAGTVHTTATAR